MQKQFEELGKSAEELEGQFQEFEKVETEEQPPSSLKACNDQSYWKLLAAWDVDFVSMEVLLGGLPILGLARPPDSDFPCGLEICTNPSTVRAELFRQA